MALAAPMLTVASIVPAMIDWVAVGVFLLATILASGAIVLARRFDRVSTSTRSSIALAPAVLVGWIVAVT